MGFFLSFTTVAAVAAAPKFHAPPKVPIKPNAEDLEVYGSVNNVCNIKCINFNLILNLVFMLIFYLSKIMLYIGQAQ